MPKTPKLAERRVIQRLGLDFEIDPEGRIWRIRRNRVPCSPARAESEGSLGYLSVSFASENAWAHRLVYQHYFGDIPEGLFINHKNGNKSDNRPSNLEAVTHSQNRRHSYLVLGERPRQGNGAPKLTAAQVAEIRLRARGGESPRSLAQQHGVTYQCVLWTLHGRSWRTAESGYDPAVHKFVRTGQRGYKLSGEAERQMLIKLDSGASIKSLADEFRVSQATIAASVRRIRDGEPRTTERLQRQRQKGDLSMRQIARMREFAGGPQELRGGTDNWLIVRGWISVDWPPWPPAARGAGTITDAGTQALRDIEERLGRIEVDRRAHGHPTGPEEDTDAA